MSLSASLMEWNREPHVYPPSHRGLPKPLALPWALKPLATAEFGVRELPGGRVQYWIRHQVLKGVTPAMLAW